MGLVVPGAWSPATAGTASPAVAAAPPPLRVMPLGDSITQGYAPVDTADGVPPGTNGGYRTDLWQLFRADGRAVDFVGNADPVGPERLGDKDHQGHGGFRIDQISGGLDRPCGDMNKGENVRKWVTLAQPDVVLLHIGTNDINLQCNLGSGSAALADRLGELIGHISQAAPKAVVYVATIVPINNATHPGPPPGVPRPPNNDWNAQARAYNARIPAIVQARGGNVRLVDMNSAVPVGDFHDGLHPTTGGYSKMAARWHAAMTSAPMSRWEAESGVLGGLTKVVDTINASGQKKVGHFDAPGSQVDLTVTAPTAGPYRIYTRGANGSGSTCSLQLTVNGGAGQRLSYPSINWDQWEIKAAEVWLKAGTNTVRLAHDTCHVEVDSIDVTPGLAMYPRAIRLSNNKILASLNTSSTGGLTDMSRFYESTDNGQTFQPVGEVRDPEAANGNGACCGSLFEMPDGTGTLLWGTTVGMEVSGVRRPAIRVWRSTDGGRNWSYLSSCATAGSGTNPWEGLWEPEFSVDAQGYLNCFFSYDTRYESGESTQVISVVTSKDAGRTWTERPDVVNLGADHRPGMPVVRKLKDDSYVMSYEVCGKNQGAAACKVHFRKSTNGIDWGDPKSPGEVATTPDIGGGPTKVQYHAPTVAWGPSASAHGRVFMVGGLVKDQNGAILPESGKRIFVNTEKGAGNWYEIEAPVQVSFTAAPGTEELVCNNYSSALLPSADGTGLLQIATKRIGDPNTGRCTAVFGSASAQGTGGDDKITHNATYKVRSLPGDDKCVEVGLGSDVSVPNVQQWACNRLPRQDWKVEKVGEYFEFHNVASGKCLEVAGGATQQGAVVQQGSCGNTNANLWKFVNVGHDYYTIKAKHSGLCLDLDRGLGDNGTKIQQWTCNGQAPQIWRTELKP
ncbi:hypothetical protein GCM10010411_58700 [Actinomadura fulvescens]|uniref:CBM6 domain-containing protein n=1 Tax=Actinomadura fulvescens TaxID=46160 RepID=A0ABN3Q3Y7_9ACTN